MATKTDALLAAYERALREPWATTLSGQERVWFLVYEPAEQRKVDLRLGDFETLTRQAHRGWFSISLKNCFPRWMADHEYREAYFADPEALADQLDLEFKPAVIAYLTGEIQRASADENTVIALRDVASLFGFVRLSEILNAAAKTFRGRLLVFFPGEFQHNQYRLLDARDGWSYLARPITA